jgi:hypothetical protein
MAARRPTRSDEVPEADAFEQARPAAGDDAEFDDERPPLAEVPAEVPEADALEQATVADEGDEDWRDREP